MDIIPNLGGQKILVVANQHGTVDQIRSMLALLQVVEIGSAADIQSAAKALARGPVDIILCSDNLGADATGQHFLEYLRAQEIIGPKVIFVMISGGEAHAEIMRAAECSPDDYLLWPFTATLLAKRLGAQLAKRQKFANVLEAMARKNWSAALAASEAILREKSPHHSDARKLKGQILLQAGENAAAVEHYENILADGPAGWAKLGLARALSAQKQFEESTATLESLIQENRLMMGAYDALATVMSHTDRAKEAVAVLQSAMAVSPGTALRTRTLGNLAFNTGDLALAEQTTRRLIDRYKHSPIKMSEDYLLASKTLAAIGKADEALSLVNEAKSAFGEDLDTHTLAIAEATAQVALGNFDAAKQALQKAPATPLKEMSAAAAAALSTVHYKTGDTKKGEEVLRHLVQNNPEDRAVLQTVQTTLAAVGKNTESQSLVDSSLKEIIQVNDEGVTLAYAGELDSAVEKLTVAAERLPGNLQIVSNAALVIALALSKGKSVKDGMRACLKYRQTVMSRDSRHPKLAQIDQLLKQIKTGANAPEPATSLTPA